MQIHGLHKVHTYLLCMLDLSISVWATNRSDLSPCWYQQQLHRNTHRLPIPSNVCICK